MCIAATRVIVGVWKRWDRFILMRGFIQWHGAARRYSYNSKSLFTPPVQATVPCESQPLHGAWVHVLVQCTSRVPSQVPHAVAA